MNDSKKSSKAPLTASSKVTLVLIIILLICFIGIILPTPERPADNYVEIINVEPFTTINNINNITRNDFSGFKIQLADTFSGSHGSKIIYINGININSTTGLHLIFAINNQQYLQERKKYALNTNFLTIKQFPARNKKFNLIVVRGNFFIKTIK